MARTLLVLLAFFTATSGTAQRGSTLTVSTFLRPKTADTRSLLVSIGGTTMSADRIVLELSKRSIAESAKAELLPSGWTARRKGKRIELTGPERALPIRVRLDFGSPEALEFVDVKVFSNKRVVHESRGTPQSLDAVELVQDASAFVLLPPLLTPGEVFEMTVLDVRKTSGVWFLGEKAAVATDAGTASRPILQMRVPDDAAPGRPLELSYVEPWGETAVRAWLLRRAASCQRHHAARRTLLATHRQPCRCGGAPALIRTAKERGCKAL